MTPPAVSISIKKGSIKALNRVCIRRNGGQEFSRILNKSALEWALSQYEAAKSQDLTVLVLNKKELKEAIARLKPKGRFLPMLSNKEGL